MDALHRYIGKNVQKKVEERVVVIEAAGSASLLPDRLERCV